MAFWISDQVYIQASGMKENPGFTFAGMVVAYTLTESL
ncbi:hypothetical protein HP15_2781 [Marinobacter adhaerens HP15]|uniref:Uncharacterized protein n=1 Tax=Marinobacter adhaerens (strain DSM 23420 / HP15) TaxID=225937 RepID=E4PLF4_MARAH|nr:hypothetical protein HP15_2781 [Marinobacter adhaerens HP15]